MNGHTYYIFTTPDLTGEICRQLRFCRNVAVIACANAVLLTKIVSHQRREIKRLKEENRR